MGGLYNNKFDYEGFCVGSNYNTYEFFGAHKATVKGKKGFVFRVWAPDVKSVRVTGSFCAWDESGFLLQGTGDIYEGFVSDVEEGDYYKYIIETQDGRRLYKADPYAFYAEKPPGTASRVYDISGFKWTDEAYLNNRKKHPHSKMPLNIYEVHLGSWKTHGGEDYFSYDELSDELIKYVKEMGYTHIELLPVMGHPFSGSWGYQTTSYYAPTSRYGTPHEFMNFINEAHKAGIGVILDWAAGHFCRDEHGLAFFNGQKLYELKEHPNWGTNVFDFGRGQVCSFLISNALYWLREYHADGIRVDGVSSMIYRNFGIENPKERVFNADGSEDNYEAVAFLQKLNTEVGTYHPDVMMIAEESTAWPLVTYPPSDGGLGFHYKWDMGWMHDTLNYVKTDFPYKEGNHNLLTFSTMYAFNENFICALSHDEVVHGKCSIIGRMPGDYWRKFAGVRALFAYQMFHTGAKLNFMGAEFGQFIEWRYYEGLEWFMLEYEAHEKLLNFSKALNHFYLNSPALWQKAYDYYGFKWIDADNSKQSTIVFARYGENEKDTLLIVINFLPECYDTFRIGVPFPGTYEEVFNSDDEAYGGSGRLNTGKLKSEAIPWHGQEESIVIKTPPIGAAVFKCVRRKPKKKKGNDEK